MNQNPIINIWLFPGKGLYLKHYKSYFPHANLIISKEQPENTNIILCHSKGIHEAITHLNLPIIALDPSIFPNYPNIIYFTHEERIKEISLDVPKNQIHIYTPNTHYPHMVKDIRNKIWKVITNKL